MKYCSNCGKQVEEGVKYCGKCGSKVIPSRISKRDGASERVMHNEEYAGFWIRLGAYSIDILGTVGVVMVLSLFLGELVYGIPDTLLGYIAYVIYSTLSLSIWSTTIGKGLYGLRVKAEEGSDLKFKVALKRSLLQPLSTAFFGVGYWHMNKNDKRQAWHDTKSSTIVMRERKNLILAYTVTVIAVVIWAYLYSLGSE